VECGDGDAVVWRFILGRDRDRDRGVLLLLPVLEADK
jgi:hypothetical protein